MKTFNINPESATANLEEELISLSHYVEDQFKGRLYSIEVDISNETLYKLVTHPSISSFVNRADINWAKSYYLTLFGITFRHKSMHDNSFDSWNGAFQNPRVITYDYPKATHYDIFRLRKV